MWLPENLEPYRYYDNSKI